MSKKREAVHERGGEGFSLQFLRKPHMHPPSTQMNLASLCIRLALPWSASGPVWAAFCYIWKAQ